MGTVQLLLFYVSGLCSYYLEGIYLQNLDIYIATVHPSSSYNSGLCSHPYEGITPLLANNIAIVYLCPQL